MLVSARLLRAYASLRHHHFRATLSEFFMSGRLIGRTECVSEAEFGENNNAELSVKLKKDVRFI